MGLTVTAAVWVIPADPSPVVAVAEMVFPCATVELSFAANTPLPLVVPVAEGVKALLVPVDATVTEAPPIRLLN